MCIDESDYQILVAKQSRFEKGYEEACQALGKPYVSLQEIRKKLPKLAKKMNL